MATETLTQTTRNAIRDWLRLVGEVYAITEKPHHIKRPDDSLKPGSPSKGLHQWFTYQFLRSQQLNTQPRNCSTASGNDGDMEYYMPFERDLRIECHSEDGMEILEALLVSVSHPSVESILNAARVVIVDCPDGVQNETEDDESDIMHLYSVTFRTRVHTHFELISENHVWDNYALTGNLTLLDDVSTIVITATDA